MRRGSSRFRHVTPPADPLRALGLAAAISLAIALLPVVNILGYPFRLLITIVHELSHGLAALLTGGVFLRFVIFSNGAGLAYIAGGWSWVILPAGYLGTALFAAWLIRLGRRTALGRPVLIALGATILLLTLRYGLPSIFSRQILSGVLTVVSGVLLGAGCCWVGWRARPQAIMLLLNLIAIQAGMTAFSDLMVLVGVSSSFFAAPVSDASLLAQRTWIPAIVWASLWAVTAVLLIGWAIWSTWLRPVARLSGGKQTEERPLP